MVEQPAVVILLRTGARCSATLGLVTTLTVELHEEVWPARSTTLSVSRTLVIPWADLRDILVDRYGASMMAHAVLLRRASVALAATRARYLAAA